MTSNLRINAVERQNRRVREARALRPPVDRDQTFQPEREIAREAELAALPAHAGVLRPGRVSGRHRLRGRGVGRGIHGGAP